MKKKNGAEKAEWARAGRPETERMKRRARRRASRPGFLGCVGANVSWTFGILVETKTLKTQRFNWVISNKWAFAMAFVSSFFLSNLGSDFQQDEETKWFLFATSYLKPTPPWKTCKPSPFWRGALQNKKGAERAPEPKPPCFAYLLPTPQPLLQMLIFRGGFIELLRAQLCLPFSVSITFFSPLSLSLSLFLSVRLPACLTACLPVCLSVSQSVSRSVGQSVSQSLSHSVSLSACLRACLPACLHFVCLSLFFSFFVHFLSIYLSIHPSIDRSIYRFRSIFSNVSFLFYIFPLSIACFLWCCFSRLVCILEN